jgi:hypothetical protein
MEERKRFELLLAGTFADEAFAVAVRAGVGRFDRTLVAARSSRCDVRVVRHRVNRADGAEGRAVSLQRSLSNRGLFQGSTT